MNASTAPTSVIELPDLTGELPDGLDWEFAADCLDKPNVEDLPATDQADADHTPEPPPTETPPTESLQDAPGSTEEASDDTGAVLSAGDATAATVERQAPAMDCRVQPAAGGGGRLATQRRVVGDLSIRLAELAAERKSLKKQLDAAVELLAKMEANEDGEVGEVGEVVEAGASAAGVEVAGVAAGVAAGCGTNDVSGAAAAEAVTGAAAGLDVAEARPIDPALTTPLEDLCRHGLTPGRLEKLQAVDMGAGRTASNVADLETLIRDGRLQYVKGFGPKAIDSTTDALLSWRSSNPVPAAPAVPAVPAESNPSPATPAPAMPSSTEADRDPNVKTKPKSEPPEQSPEAKEQSNALGELIDVPANLLNDTTPADRKAIEEAYKSGCEAAIANGKVTANPHPQGTIFWQAWDKGFQDCYVGDEG